MNGQSGGGGRKEGVLEKDEEVGVTRSISKA